MKEDPPLNVKCKDKFLVQSTVIPPGMEPNDVVRIRLVARRPCCQSHLVTLLLQWTSIAADKSIEVHQQKLKVVYLPGDGILHEEEEPETHQTSVMTDADSVRTPCIIPMYLD